ncbi:hypothetical protein GCM10010124_18560 [Pilimelia terevasa]|uniref:Uncharacterized protein n=1 Tax=Pilimelia terevasa TaxID=53372 RepID=A0A8J3BT59_9ACTN|nr:hypothetical protein [Pilimelia terevasa]GGK26192.1 hypothetical protein GCM10010124_18560 [Pilimelia terevasa]
MVKELIALAVVLAVLGGTWWLGQRTLARAHDGAAPRVLSVALAFVLLVGGAIVLWPVLAQIWHALTR